MGHNQPLNSSSYKETQFFEVSMMKYQEQHLQIQQSELKCERQRSEDYCFVRTHQRVHKLFQPTQSQEVCDINLPLIKEFQHFSLLKFEQSECFMDRHNQHVLKETAKHMVFLKNFARHFNQKQQKLAQNFHQTSHQILQLQDVTKPLGNHLQLTSCQQKQQVNEQQIKE